MVWSLSARKAPIQPAQPSEHLLLLYLKVDKVVTGEVVEVLVAWYHVVGHNSDRQSHPDTTTEAGPIYPHGLGSSHPGPQILNPTPTAYGVQLHTWIHGGESGNALYKT